MNLQALPRWASRVAQTIRFYRNWPTLVFGDLGRAEVTRISLRNGPTLLGVDDSVRVIVREVFEEQHYGPAPSGVVLDIGANIGVYSVFAAGTAERVHAFEPFPGNIALLKRNAQDAGCLDRITVYPVALSDHEDGAELFLSRRAGGHLLFADNGREILDRSVSVPTRTLASILDNEITEPRISVAKMDCEGSEGAILSTLDESHFARIEAWLIEYHNNVSAMSHEDIAELLSGHDYRVTVVPNSIDFGYIEARR